jgi:phosphoribosylanthranilate isomerase
MTRIKICGLSTPEAVDAALAGGADYLGFVFFAASPRAIAPGAARRLAEPAGGKAKIVAVTVDPDDALIDSLVETLGPDLIQLHGTESPARVRQVAERAGVGVIKAITVAGAADVQRARDYEGAAAHLMFDAPAPTGSARPGGHGEGFEASALAGQAFARPWFLAGGLDPWNVAAALAASGAPMVDVSSGVERGPGLKDPALIAAFIEAVRRTP